MTAAEKERFDYQLRRLRELSRVSLMLARRTREWFSPEDGNLSPRAKKSDRERAIRIVWNAAQDVYRPLYPNSEIRSSARSIAASDFIGHPVWDMYFNTVEDLMERFDEFLDHLGWRGLFDGTEQMDPVRLLNPKCRQVSAKVLGRLERSAERLKSVCRQANRERRVFEIESKEEGRRRKRDGIFLDPCGKGGLGDHSG